MDNIFQGGLDVLTVINISVTLTAGQGGLAGLSGIGQSPPAGHDQIRPKRISSKDLEAAGYSATSFGNPDHAVHYYFAHLCGKPGLLYSDKDEEAFCVDPEVHGRLYRRQELRQKLVRIL